MLYERWRQVARAHAGELAVWDAASGEGLTFGQLAGRADDFPGGVPGIVHPRGRGLEFVLSVLTAWRAGSVVCPLEADQVPPDPPGIPAGCVHLKTTSASTGAARLIAFTAAQLAADALNIVETMGLRPGWPNLGAISLAHSYGFSNLILPLLLHGVPLLLVDSPLPETIRKVAANWESLTLPAVPALWRAWHEAGAIPANVRLAISAGAPLPLSLEREILLASGLKVHNFYGASECGGIAYDGTAEARAEGSCVGAPMKNVSLEVGAEGCLEVRSQAVGMACLPGADARLRGGCFRTSDLARIEGGRVHLLGRAGDVIHVAGRKVVPEAIEQALRTHPAIVECVVFGTRTWSAERGEMIVACVAVREEVGSELLRRHLLERLPSWQIPRDWWFVHDLPANQRGKISRAAWRERYLARRDRPAG